MALWAARERADSCEEQWDVASWSSHSDGEQDALFGSLGEDVEPQQEQEDMASMTVDPLELVERLSWDEASQDSSDEEQDELQLPGLLHSQVQDHNRTQEALTLVSPCSEPSPPAYLSPLTRVSISSPMRPKVFFQERQESDESEEEVKTLGPETSWSPHTDSILFTPPTKTAGNPFISNQEPEKDEKGETGSPLRPSLLPRAPQWRRQKARTCSGAGSAGMPTALSLATFKARTRSLSRARKQNLDDDDDGDFSSDDEGYTPELHRRRGSDAGAVGASHWRRARNTSINFASHRLSVNVTMSPAMMSKTLQDAKRKLSGGLHFVRSGSTTSTVASDESYLDSPYCDENKSAPAGLALECGDLPDKQVRSNSCASASDVGNNQRKTRQQQLRAGVFKAAGYLSAASTEAARKLKSRTGGFHAPHLQRHKAAASETEEEELEGSTPPTQAISAAP